MKWIVWMVMADTVRKDFSFASSSVEVEVKSILLLLSASHRHILLLLSWLLRAERIVLLLLHWRLTSGGWSSEGIEWVLAHRSRHTWLVSVHAHGGAHAASHHLIAHHWVHALHWHATCHWACSEWIRLETTLSCWLLHRAKSVCILLGGLIGSHELGERIITR